MKSELATIRRAYRYVVAYERRILDAISRVDEVVQKAGLARNAPHRWWPLYTDFPSRAWAPDRWAWDHHPCYASRFEWSAGAENTAGNRYLDLDHIADTSFERKRLADDREPEPIEGLPAVEDARSILRWSLTELRSPVTPAVWNLDWEKFLSKQFGLAPQEVLMSEQTSPPVQRESPEVVLTRCCVDLANVTDADALDRLFIAPLRAALGSTV